jgi:hypothetical protein
MVALQAIVAMARGEMWVLPNWDGSLVIGLWSFAEDILTQLASATDQNAHGFPRAGSYSFPCRRPRLVVLSAGCFEDPIERK